MKISMVLILGWCLLIATTAETHALSATWSWGFGDAEDQRPPSDVAIDPTGNIFLTGYFGGQLDFGGGPLVGNEDAYLVKLDPDGNHLWSQSFGDNGWQFGYSVAADPDGNVVMVGAFTYTVDFGGGPLVSTGPAGPDMFDCFVVKFDGEGNHLWSFSFGGNGDDFANTVTIGSDGNIAVSGTYMLSVDLFGNLLPDFGFRDFFIAVFGPDGSHLWSRGMGGPAMDGVNEHALDDLDCFVMAGTFRETIDLGGGPLTAVGERDAYLVKYDNSGSHLWSSSFGDGDDVDPNSLCTDVAGNTFLAGWFEGGIDFGSGPLISAGGKDVFLAKFDQNGGPLWSHGFGDENGQYIFNGIETWNGTGILMTGSFTGELDFGGGPLLSAGGEDVFLAHLDGSGNQVRADAFGDTSSQRGSNVAVATPGWFVLTGWFQGGVDFGNGLIPSSGGWDLFLARFDPFPSAIAVLGQPGGIYLASYPNPFNPQTTIVFEILERQAVTLRVFDMSGRLVKELITFEPHTPGRHEVVWNGRDDSGRQVASGTYFYRLEAGSYSETKRMVLIK
jgi:hypothetical protein